VRARFGSGFRPVASASRARIPLRSLGSTPALAGAVALAATLVVLTSGAGQSAAEVSVVPLPTISVHSSVIRIEHKRVLLITSILLGNIEGVRSTITCGRCERIRATLRESHPTAASKRYVGVDWLIPIGRHIVVAVTRPGEIGRYLLLGAGAHDALVYKDTGCLAPARSTHITCPQTAPTIQKESVVTGGNPGSKTPAETPAEAEKNVKAEEGSVKKEEEAAAKKKSEEEKAAAEAKRQKEKEEEEARQRQKAKEEEEARNRTYSETPGPDGAPTFTDYEDEGGKGPQVPEHETVQVQCRVEGLEPADHGIPDDWYYRVASAPWDDVYYAYAEPFYNEPGVTSGSLIGTPPVETQVPVC
jgi:hypothetical protein